MSSYPDILQDIFDISLSILAEEALSDEQAKIIATNLVERVQQKNGGSMLYIPKHETKAIKAALQQRNQQIVTEFTGNNQAQLSHKFHLSIKCIYEILRTHFQSKQTSWLDMA